MWLTLIFGIGAGTVLASWIWERRKSQRLFRENQAIRAELEALQRQKTELSAAAEGRNEKVKKCTATIFLYSQLLEEAAKSSRLKEYSQVILHEVQRLLKIIEEPEI